MSDGPGNIRANLTSRDELSYPIINGYAELLSRDPLLPAYVLLQPSVVGAVWKLQQSCRQAGLAGALARALEELLVGWEAQEQEMMENGASRAALISIKMGLERDKLERKRQLGLL